MRNKYYIVGEGLLYNKSSGGNLLWGKVYSMTPALSQLIPIGPDTGVIFSLVSK